MGLCLFLLVFLLKSRLGDRAKQEEKLILKQVPSRDTNKKEGVEKENRGDWGEEDTEGLSPGTQQETYQLQHTL